METVSSAPNPSEDFVLTLAVVDDDPVFGRLIEALAAAPDVRVRHWTTLPPRGARVDVLAVDYELGAVDGLAVAEEAASRHPHVPVLLISHGQGPMQRPAWPDNVVGFVDKALGPEALVDAARQAAAR